MITLSEISDSDSEGIQFSQKPPSEPAPQKTTTPKPKPKPKKEELLAKRPAPNDHIQKKMEEQKPVVINGVVRTPDQCPFNRPKIQYVRQFYNDPLGFVINKKPPTGNLTDYQNREFLISQSARYMQQVLLERSEYRDSGEFVDHLSTMSENVMRNLTKNKVENHYIIPDGQMQVTILTCIIC